MGDRNLRCCNPLVNLRHAILYLLPSCTVYKHSHGLRCSHDCHNTNQVNTSYPHHLYELCFWSPNIAVLNNLTVMQEGPSYNCTHHTFFASARFEHWSFVCQFIIDRYHVYSFIEVQKFLQILFCWQILKCRSKHFQWESYHQSMMEMWYVIQLVLLSNDEQP